MSSMPAIFVSHGPPTLALMPDHPAHRFFRDLGQTLPRSKAIVCISAHWETVWPVVTGTARPETIHDFSGPPPLFAMTYPAPGALELALEITENMKEAGIKAAVEPDRGLDHGMWIPLMLTYPGADIPVVQLSLQTDLDPRHHLQLGEILSPLRQKGVLILGSGGATHNLNEIHGNALDAEPPGYARAFDEWLRESVISGDTEALADYKARGPEAERNHPFPAEHFLPLFVPMGAAGPVATGRLLHQGFMYGVLSMAAYAWD